MMTYSEIRLASTLFPTSDDGDFDHTKSRISTICKIWWLGLSKPRAILDHEDDLSPSGISIELLTELRKTFNS